MTTPGSAPNRKTRDVAQDRWTPFLAEFTRENRGAHARLTIIGVNTEVGVRVETENRPFDGVSADLKDGEAVNSTHGVYDTLIASKPGSVRGYLCNASFWDVGTRDDLAATDAAFRRSGM